MSKKKIYYFSGTGNSLHAAIHIARTIKPVQTISMRCDPASHPAIDADVIGFIFPVYHWSLPDFASRFIDRLAINPNAYIFAVASCGGLPVNALNDMAALLAKKGAVLSYSRVHNNVASYVAAYEPFPPPEKQLPKAAAELENIAEDILNRASNSPVKSSLKKELMRLIEKPFVKALPTKDKGFSVSDGCISCGACARICTPRNIAMENGKPVFRHNCTQCMACIVFCPRQAIHYKNKTQKRTRYHHPDINVKMMEMDVSDF